MHHPSNAYGQGRLTLFCLYLALYNGTAQQAGLHAVPFPLATHQGACSCALMHALHAVSFPPYAATSQLLAECSLVICAMKHPAATPGHSEPCCLIPLTMCDGIY